MVGAGLLMSACNTTAPAFVFGQITPDTSASYPQSFVVANSGMHARGRLASFSIPTAAALGKVRINAYIPDPWLPEPTSWIISAAKLVSPFLGAAEISGVGDNRGPDPTTDAFASRMSIQLDFASGSGQIYMNDSCVDLHLAILGPGSTPSYTPCRDAEPFSTTIGDPDTNGFRSTVVTGAGGRIDIYLLLSAKNAWSRIGPLSAPAPYNCAIDVGFHLWTDQGALKAETWEPFGAAVDKYPALEAYWYDGLGHQDVSLLQRPADPSGVQALCANEYHS